MIVEQKIIARKYARAFLNLYFDALAEQHVEALSNFYTFLRGNRGILCYLNLPGLTEQSWNDFLTRLYATFPLPYHFGRLIQALLERRRVELLPAVVAAVLEEFLRRKHVLHFQVTSSHELSSVEQNHIIAFLTKKTGAAAVQATFAVDPALICGIKMRSDMYMFEHSIARELKNFEESLLQRVRL